MAIGSRSTDDRADDRAQEQRQLDLLRVIAEQEIAGLHEGRKSWATWLDEAARYEHLGFTNTLLVAAQAPAATQLRSYEDWQAHGRQVRRGEHGIRVISRAGRPYSLFDLAQTDGAEPPPVPPADPAQLYEALRALLTDRNIHLDRGDDYWHRATDGRAVVALDPAADDLNAAFQAAHQLAHVLNRDHPDAAPQGCKGVRRVAADSAACLLLARYGLRPAPLQFPPVSLWAGADLRARPLNAVAQVGDRILRTSARMGRTVGGLPTARPQPVDSPRVTVATETTAAKEDLGVRGDTVPDDVLLDLHKTAHAFYMRQYKSSWAPAYLTGRGLPGRAGQDWQLGYAPRAWRTLTGHLLQLGFTDEQLLASGLVRRGRNRRLYDTFRDRLVLPLRDAAGRVVAFTGRRRDQADGPKYLNSPETAIFHKKELLFGLHEAAGKLATGARPVLVEGPLDAIAIDTIDAPAYAAVSPCGTALTTGQIQALARATHLDQIGMLVVFDSDPAGQDATLRTWDLLATTRAPIDAAVLPEGHDPASLLHQCGPQALHRALQTAAPLADLVIDTRIRKAGGTLQFFQQRCTAAQAAAAVIARLPPDQITRQIIATAARLDLPNAVLTQAVMAAISPVDTAIEDFPLPPLDDAADPDPHPARLTQRRTDRPRRTR